MLNEPALNSFNKQLTDERTKDSLYRIVETRQVPVEPLSAILDEHLGDEKIDFLDVDAEGMDLEVLLSNDWTRYRPRVVLVEMLGMVIDEAEDNATYKFLTGEGYELKVKTIRTGIFVEREKL